LKTPQAAGGVAVALFTPWCFVKLLQINWEARENLEAVLPSVVQWVRENRGIYIYNKKQNNEKIKHGVHFFFSKTKI
jgi:hypothetical protein